MDGEKVYDCFSDFPVHVGNITRSVESHINWVIKHKFYCDVPLTKRQTISAPADCLIIY